MSSTKRLVSKFVWIRDWVVQLGANIGAGRKKQGRRERRFQPTVERLEDRTVMNTGGGFTGGGVLGQYYANVTNPTNWLNTMSSYTPAFSRTDVRIDFTTSNTAPGGVVQDSNYAAVGATNFAVKWTGSFIPAFTESYTFKTITDDGVLLKINGSTVIINNFTYHAPTTNTFTITLTAGRTYSIEMDYFQGVGSWTAQLHWLSSNTNPSAAGYFAEEAIEPATPIGVNYQVDPKEFANVVLFGSYRYAVTTNPSDGWPTQDFQLTVFYGGEEYSQNDAGTYLLQFTGEAQVTDGSGPVLDFKVGNTDYGATLPFGKGFNPSTGLTTATIAIPDISHYNGISLAFTKTQRTGGGGGVTNINLMRPTTLGGTTDYPVGTLFTNAGLAVAAPYTALRMNGWTFTWSTDVDWSQRALPNVDFWDATGDGMAWETAVAVANATGKDIYIDIPPDVSDAYITDLANLLKYGSDGVNPYTSPQAHPVWAALDSNLNVYIEYGNEFWNWGSSIYSDINKQVMQNEQNNTANGQLFKSAGGWDIINANGTPGGSDTSLWVVVMDVDISNIFRQVYGNAAMPANAQGVVSADPRIRPLFEWQYGGSWNGGSDPSNIAMSKVSAQLPNPIKYYIWGGGGGWYSDDTASGFSDVEFTNPNFDSGTAGWTFSSGAGVVANGSPLGNLPAPTEVAPSSPAKTTTNVAYLQPGASMSQSVYFSGGYADIAFYASTNAAFSYNNSMKVTIDGQAIPISEGAWGYAGQNTWTWDRSGAFDTGASPGWHTITFSWTAMAGVDAFIANLGIQTVNGLFKEEAVQGQPNLNVVLSDVAICVAFGLHDVGYEGGFDFNQNRSSGGTNTGYKNIDVAGYSSLVPNVGMYANLDPRAKQLAINTLDQFFQNGGALPFEFQSMGNLNSWGIETPSIYSAVGATTTLPKVEATVAVGKSLPLGVTFTVAGSSFAAPSGDWQSAGSKLTETFLETSAKTYNVGLTIANTGNGATGTFQIVVDGKVIKTINVTDSSTVPFTVAYPISFGVHTISIVCVSVKKSHSFGLELTSLVVD